MTKKPEIKATEVEIRTVKAAELPTSILYGNLYRVLLRGNIGGSGMTYLISMNVVSGRDEARVLAEALAIEHGIGSIKWEQEA
jgi:hypothetical protein